MSRIGDCDDYYEEYPNQQYLQQQAAVNAIRGKRGQKLLRELEQALLALPEKRLIAGSFCDGKEVCAGGALALYREVLKGRRREEVLAELASRRPSYEDGYEGILFVRDQIGCVESLAAAIVWENDGYGDYLRADCRTPEGRYNHVLEWVRRHLKNDDLVP
jgi:hypothetical protein